MSRMNYITATIIVSIMCLGCAGSSGNSPLSPDTLNPQPGINTSQTTSNHSLFGYYNCSYNRETVKIECTPARAAMWHFNLVSLLNVSNGLNVAINFGESDPSNGLVVVDIDLTHPYPDNKSYSGFDVRGIIITTAEHFVDGMYLPGNDDLGLLNADGYTRWWNPREFTTPGRFGFIPGNQGMNPPPGIVLDSTINPYKQFANALGKTTPVGKLKKFPIDGFFGRGVFRVGSTLQREYRMLFPVSNREPETYFDYAVDMSWDPPLVNPPTVPDDFPMAANSVEPWLIRSWVTGNTMQFNPGGSVSGFISLNLTIFDWQGWVEGYGGQLGAITAYSPGIAFYDSVTPIYTTNPNGSASASVTFEGTPVTSGTVPIWIGVASPGSTYSQGTPTAPDADLEAFKRIEVEIPGESDLMDWFVHVYIVRDSNGQNAATGMGRVFSNVGWANQLYNARLNCTINLVDISYIDQSTWLALTVDEAESMFQQYGDRSGVTNIFYVNSMPDVPGATGYAYVWCTFEEQTSNTTYIVINDDATNVTLAHELAHTNGMLVDAYLLDYYTCEQIKSMSCGSGPADMYCEPGTNVYGNLMYLYNGDSIDNYYFTTADMAMNTPLIDSQSENILYFQTNYPDNFRAP